MRTSASAHASAHANIEIPVAQRIYTLEAGGVVSAPARSAPTPDARAQFQSNLPSRSTRRFSKCAIATVTIPTLLTTAGLALIGDGVRKRVQTGGFAKEMCRNNGVLVPISSPEANDCDKYEKDAGGNWTPVVEYDPADHGSRSALSELMGGAFVTTLGTVATGTAVWLVKTLYGGLRT